MSDAKKNKFLTKTVRFGTKTVTLFSIDGHTWSSRRSELHTIKERQEAQRVTLGDIKEEDEQRPAPEAAESDDGPVEVVSEDAAEESPTASAKTGKEVDLEEEIEIEEEIVDDLIIEEDLPVVPPIVDEAELESAPRPKASVSEKHLKLTKPKKISPPREKPAPAPAPRVAKRKVAARTVAPKKRVRVKPAKKTTSKPRRKAA